MWGGSAVRKHNGEALGWVYPKVPIRKPVFNLLEVTLKVSGASDFGNRGSEYCTIICIEEDLTIWITTDIINVQKE